MGHVLRPQFMLDLGLKWIFLYQILAGLVYRNSDFIPDCIRNHSNYLSLQKNIEQEMNITGDADVRHSDEYLPQEELICHLKSLEWEQARLRGEVGRTCPPFWDRYT